MGPSGYDHQASVSLLTACPGRHFVVCSGLCVLLLLRLAVFSAWLSARLCFQQADIRVARGVYFVLMRLLSLKAIKRFIKGLSPKV